MRGKPLKGPVPVRLHPLYARWNHMRQCVYKTTHADYPNHGGRGIQIGPEFTEFWDYVDLIETHLGPQPGPSNIWKLARKDQNGDFTIANMEWSVPKEVGRRLYYTKYLTYNGRRQTLRDWAEQTGINFNTIISRVERGWRPAQILGDQLGPRQEYIKLKSKRNS